MPQPPLADLSRARLSPDPAVAALLDQQPCSIGAVLDRRAAATPDLVGWRYPDADDVWRDLTWGQLHHRVRAAAAGLLELGLRPGERVAIAAGTSLDWIVADFAITYVGGVTSTIYPTARPEDAHHVLGHSASRFLLVEDAPLLARLLGDEPLPDAVAQVVFLHAAPTEADATATDGDAEATEAGADGPAADAGTTSWAELLRRGEQALAADPGAVDARRDATGPDTLATIIYTSGTTGRPKGVELTHGAWVYQGRAWAATGLLRPDDLHFLWLPMSHAFGKCLVLVCVEVGAPTAVDGRVDRLMDNLAAVRPTMICGVPRIFEKIRAAVITAVPRNGLKGRAARWAFDVGSQAYPHRIEGRRPPLGLAVRYAAADRLVYRRLRALLGGRIRFLISGSAKLSPQIQRWFFSGGLLITEGYGVTESAAVTFYNLHREPRFGTVGTIAPGSACRIAPDGEILLRGPGLMRGYHEDPERTAEALRDGWLHTGDIGELDEDGFLSVTDRKRDLIKTSGGKFVSPSDVEGAVVANCPYVAQVVVAGEGRGYISALLVLDRDAVLAWGRRHGHPEQAYAELTRHPELRRVVQHGVDAANGHLAHWSRVKRYAVLDHEFTVEAGDVTPNMKVRRDRVLQRYAGVVDSLYADA